MGDAECGEADLDHAERAEDHRCVDVAHVRDAKCAPGQLADPGAEHDAALVLAIGLQAGGIVAVAHANGGDRIRPFSRRFDVEGEDLSLRPCRNGAADGLGQQAMAQEDVVESFREQHVEGLPQGEQQVHRGCAGIFAIVLDALALAPVPVGRSQARSLVHFARAIVDRDEAEPRGRHQAFLRGGHGDVDAPRIHLERHAAERGHRIHHEQSIVLRGLDGASDGGNIVEGARRGIDLHHHDRLDLAFGILAQPCLHLGRANRTPHIALQDLDLDAHGARGVTPVDGEAAALEHQDLVAARQHIAEHGLPCAMAVGDIDVRVPSRSEQPL